MNRHSKSISARTVSVCGILAALALIFSYIEAILPLSTGIPGVKLGVANLAVVVALYLYGFPFALFVNLIRILIAGLLFNGLFGAVYSLAGGMLSLFFMVLLKKTNLFSVAGISMAGGVAHNLGQLMVAALIISNIKLFYYFPVLLFAGMVSGILMGILAHFILQKLSRAISK